MAATIKLKLNTTELFRALDQGAPKRMYEAANELRNTVLETLTGKRTGRIYRVPGTSRTYTASSPGEPPAIVTAELRQSVKASTEGNGRAVIGKVKATAKHALPLEFGTRNMAARPFMKPSFDKALPSIKTILSRKWL